MLGCSRPSAPHRRSHLGRGCHIRNTGRRRQPRAAVGTSTDQQWGKVQPWPTQMPGNTWPGPQNLLSRHQHRTRLWPHQVSSAVTGGASLARTPEAELWGAASPSDRGTHSKARCWGDRCTHGSPHRLPAPDCLTITHEWGDPFYPLAECSFQSAPVPSLHHFKEEPCPSLCCSSEKDHLPQGSLPPKTASRPTPQLTLSPCPGPGPPALPASAAVRRPAAPSSGPETPA